MKKRGSDYRNIIVQDDEREYRVCLQKGSNRPFIVALRPKARGGNERFLKYDGRRAKKLIAMALSLESQ